MPNSKFQILNSCLVAFVVIALSLIPSESTRAAAFSTQLGASLYSGPLSENPRAGSNFTVTIKVDSLAQPVNAIHGVLAFNPERLDIIGVSKIGSVLNLWVEEPNFSNLEGALKFQGGVPKPGFIGNGGTVLHVIFRAKSPGPTSLVWKSGEVLANDGKGTNILVNLQNLDFFVEEPFAASPPIFRRPPPLPRFSPGAILWCG